jgi:hypothetical protein
MLRELGPDDDWARLAAAIRRRIDELGMANVSTLVRVSKAIDGSPNKEGVSAMSWRRLLNGQPIRRADKLQLVCRTLDWRHDSAERILAGGEPVMGVDDAPDIALLHRMNDHEVRLARVEAAIRHVSSLLEDHTTSPSLS